MTDVTIVNISGKAMARMNKLLWHESEFILAKCLNFTIEDDQKTIYTFIERTSKEALEGFLKVAFRNFSESPTRENDRNLFWKHANEAWGQRNAYVTELMQQRVPYYDKLMTHQKEVLMESFCKKDNFLAMSMGTGKTITSATISRLHKLPRTVIICPAAVKFNWFRDLQKFGFNPVYFTMYDSAKRRSFKAFIERFIIINYDIIAKYGPEIVNHEVNHFILDEAHYIKSHLSQRAKLVNKLISHSPNARITFLSGTPITNRVNDIFSYLKLTGHELGHSHKRFLDQFTIRANSRGGERVTGGKNLDDLRLKLSNFMIRKSKEDCLDLPEKVFLSYTYELDDYKDEYAKVVEELKASKEKTQLSGNIHSLNIITAMAKLGGIKEIAQNILDEERKVVIFSSYKEPLNKLQEHFGMSCVKIDGSVSAFDRDQMVQRFIEDPNVTVFLGNMQAAGVGINLVNASDVLFVNFPLVPSDFYQAVDRCHRIGQSKSVNIHLPMCVDSIDEHIHDLILEKDMEASIVIDGKINETLLKENFVDTLIKKIMGIEVVAPVVEQPSPFPVSSTPVEVKSNLDDFNEPDFL